jgi:hypothetical protein
MKIGEVLPKGSRSEVHFGYHDKMEGYTKSSSDIPKLSEIVDEEIMIFRSKTEYIEGV